MEDNRQGGQYRRFGIMVATSTVLMYGMMYLNTYQIDHVFFSQTRMWMALLMGGAMGALMLAFMWSMYKNRRANFGILAGCAIAFVLGLVLMRSQATVGDVAYMRAMIPHHSIAIMTSERAHIRDPRVRLLADRIIDAQVREIEEMKQLIRSLEQNPTRSDAPTLPSYRARGAPAPMPEQ